MVHDFAQNYLCQHQHEPQGLHWILPQVTLHPTVVHYRCPVDNCHLVTHEVVHVSDDLKHDAHLVEKFQQVTLQVLKQHKVPIHKLVKFTDHAPSQSKRKTSFNYLTKSTIPTMYCFFGVRHGKGPCDACTGRVKQAITRLVKTTTEVVNSAKWHLCTYSFMSTLSSLYRWTSQPRNLQISDESVHKSDSVSNTVSDGQSPASTDVHQESCMVPQSSSPYPYR